jgi:hypothetical protein
MESVAEKVQEVAEQVKNVTINDNKPKGEKKAKKAKEPSSDRPLEVSIHRLYFQVDKGD